MKVKQVATIDPTHIIKEGSRVTFKSILCPKNPATVIVASAITRAIVPASVDNKPPLYVPRDSLDDITLDSNDKFTPTDKKKHFKKADRFSENIKILNQSYTFKNFSRNKHDEPRDTVLRHGVRDYYMEAENYSNTDHNL